MNEFRLRFDADNDAFYPDPHVEIARILRGVADRLEGGEDASKSLNIRDLNGNVVGTFKWERSA